MGMQDGDGGRMCFTARAGSLSRRNAARRGRRPPRLLERTVVFSPRNQRNSFPVRKSSRGLSSCEKSKSARSQQRHACVRVRAAAQTDARGLRWPKG